MFEGYKANKAAEGAHSKAFFYSLFLGGQDRRKEEPAEPTCQGIDRLQSWTTRLAEWAERKRKAVKNVSGIVAERINPVTGAREVLLVRGGGKVRWQFAGGTEKPEDGGNLLQVLVREIREELQEDLTHTLNSLRYFHSFSPPQSSDAEEVWAMHAFVLEHCTWDIRDENMRDDANEHEWTSDPFRNKDGSIRRLYPQVDRVLRLRGFKGPTSEDTAPGDYYGDPTVEATVYAHLRKMSTKDLREKRDDLIHYIEQSTQYGGAGGIDEMERTRAREELLAVEEILKRRRSL